MTKENIIEFITAAEEGFMLPFSNTENQLTIELDMTRDEYDALDTDFDFNSCVVYMAEKRKVYITKFFNEDTFEF